MKLKFDVSRTQYMAKLKSISNPTSVQRSNVLWCLYSSRLCCTTLTRQSESRLCCTALECAVLPVQLSIVLYNSDLTVLYTVLECAVLSCIRLSTVLYDGCWLCCIQLSTVLYSSRSTVLYSSRRCSLCCTTLDSVCCRLSALDCAVYDSRLCSLCYTGLDYAVQV